jgi:integrase
MTKAEAQRRLDAQISKTATGGGAQLAADAPFRDVWKRYVELKSVSWSMATRRAICSVFEEAPARPKQKPRSFPPVLSFIGGRRLCELTRDPLQDCLNRLAAAGASYSYVHKARTHLAAALEYAVDERLIPTNPARKITTPTQITPATCERFYSLAEIHRLNAQAHGRERLVLRLFIDCGLRAQELFALRVNDLEPLQLRIDEALHETERGEKRIGSRTKTRSSKGYVAISADLERELHAWIQFPGAAPGELLFPSEAGTPFRIANYLKRILKPLAAKAAIADMTYQALRRTCATHLKRHVDLRGVQEQLRHASPRMSAWYTKAIPEEVRKAIESMDAELWCEKSNERIN